MPTVKVYDDYNLIALQALDTDDLEGSEFLSKFRAETRGRVHPGQKLSRAARPPARPRISQAARPTRPEKVRKKIGPARLAPKAGPKYGLDSFEIKWTGFA